uniref:Reverse transcriptase domain-containing protein n=1 Tax=Cannabis sativa TaxID=3483 RepID=A0A803PXR5_CANSA
MTEFMHTGSSSTRPSISLTDLEREVLELPTSVNLRDSGNDDVTLFARVLSSKEINRKTFRIKMSGHWKGRYPVTISDHHTGLFMVTFGCPGDKKMTLIMEPWHFQNHHIVLASPSALQNVTVDSLHYSPFWIQIHRLLYGLEKWLGFGIQEMSFELNFDTSVFRNFVLNVELLDTLLKVVLFSLINSTMELNLLFLWPDLLGSPIPSSGYDRYRTDFGKGNAWPLMTRLAKKSFADAVPKLTSRPPPYSFPLTDIESSSHTTTTTNFGHQSLTHIHPNQQQSSSHNIDNDIPEIPFPSYLPLSLPSTTPVTSSPSFATYPPSSLTIASPFSPRHIHNATPQPHLFSSATITTVPPHLPMHTNNQYGQLGTPVPSSISPFKENIKPNKITKRQGESDSLKRCHSNNSGQLASSSSEVSPNASQVSAHVSDSVQHHLHNSAVIDEDHFAPCVLFLMETKLQSGSISKFRNSLHFPHGIEVPRIGLSGGLMLLWKSDVDIAINNYSSNHIDCFVELHGGLSFHFTGFYGHPQVSHRVHTWTLLKRCFDIAPLRPWLVMGDFNEVLSNNDKIGGPIRNQHQIQAFKSTIDLCHLTPLTFEGELCTWTNKCQGAGNVKERLDYGFCNEFWADFYQPVTIKHLDFYHSDHRALKSQVLELQEQQPQPVFKSRFRLLTIWPLVHLIYKLGIIRNLRIKFFLSQPYTPEEVHHALKSMSEDKSPGLDGMSVMFYTNYWSVVGPLVSLAVLDVLNNGYDPTLLNRTLITLIPKVKKPTKITQYRPISLCNVLYKLVSKTIVLRIQPFLHLVISEFQSAFLSQRLITDNVLVAFEVLHSLKNRKRGNKGFAAMKLDMSKAFDRVEWHFIQQVMLKMGFGDTIVQLISRCVQTVSYSFLLNGAVHGFSCLLQYEESQGNLEGLKVSRSAPPVSHLLFAYDSQVINHDKCVLSFSPNTRGKQNFFQHLLGMPIQPCHERYLGLPSFSGHDKSQLFSGITDRIWKLLNSWREQLFSIGGKEVPLKAVVQAIPTYAMSCFQLPAKLCHQIEQQMARFWWGSSASGNSIHWKNWNFLCKAKVHGGMGFRNFIHFNQALLAKQAWRLMDSPNSLLSGILQHRYYVNGDLLNAGLGNTPSYTWRSIVWGKELLKKGLGWRVGTGSNIQCNSQPWIPDHSSFLPLVYKGDDAMTVAHLITGSRQWNLEALQQNFSQPDIDNILSIPLSLYPSEDIRIWHYSSTGCYTVKSGYQFDADSQDTTAPGSSSSSNDWWQNFWSLKLPSKVRIFAWRAFHDALPTAAILHFRHIASDSLCPICKLQPETIPHALLCCKRPKQVWNQWDLLPGLHLSRITSMQDFMVHVSSVLSQDLFELFITVMWCLWSERNAEYHGKKTKLVQIIYDYAVKYLADYRKAQARTSSFTQQHHTTTSANIPAATTMTEKPTPKWTAPPPGQLKLNTDAAINMSSSLIGLGAIHRNSHGKIVAAMSTSVKGRCKPEEIEAMALSWSLKTLLQLELPVHLIETDSLLVVQNLKKSTTHLTSFHAILNDVHFLVSNFPRARSANNEAHLLTKFALTVDTECIWLEEIPPPLMTVM